MLPILLFIFGTLLADAADAAAIHPKQVVENLLAAKRYDSAARFIERRPDLLEDPWFLKAYVDNAVHHAVYSDYRGDFGLIDLGPGQTLTGLRGSTHRSIKLDIPALLASKQKTLDNSPTFHAAVASFLGHYNDAAESGIALATLDIFKDPLRQEINSARVAYRAGLLAGPALARYALRHAATGQRFSKDLIGRLEQEFKRRPDVPEIQLALARAYFRNGVWSAALSYADMAAGRFENAKKDAEAYYTLGRIQAAMGLHQDAEGAFLSALEKQPGEAKFLKALWSSNRSHPKQYVREVVRRIQKDPSLKIFETYVDFRQQAGAVSADAEIEKQLLRKKPKRKQDAAPYYFFLGQLAEQEGEKKEAFNLFKRSLKAYGRLERAPEHHQAILRARVLERDGNP